MVLNKIKQKIKIILLEIIIIIIDLVTHKNVALFVRGSNTVHFQKCKQSSPSRFEMAARSITDFTSSSLGSESGPIFSDEFSAPGLAAM